jgi:dsRNA-specific ribonuclease
MSTGAWEKNLRIAIKRNIIPVLIPDAETNEVQKHRAELLVDEQRMLLWSQIFTDSAVSEICYEPYESYGDKIANQLVVKWIMRNEPTVQPDQINSLVSHYASNKVQGDLMKKFTVVRKIRGEERLENFIEAYMRKPEKKTGMVVTQSIQADMYEALLGGICTAGDSIVDGLGMIYAALWFEHIFVKNIPKPDMQYSRGKASSILLELFSRFEFYNTKSIKLDVNYKDQITKKGQSTKSNVSYIISFSSSVRNFLSGLSYELFRYSQQLPVAGTTIGEATAPNKAEAREEASVAALNYLDENLGITPEWAASVKNTLDMQTIEQDPILNDAYKTILNYVQGDGYQKIRFKNIGKHSIEGNVQGIQIVGEAKDGRTKVFFTRAYEEGSRYEVRRNAIADFAKEIKRKD